MKICLDPSLVSFDNGLIYSLTSSANNSISFISLGKLFMNIKTRKVQLLISEEHRRVYSMIQNNRYQFLHLLSVKEYLQTCYLLIVVNVRSGGFVSFQKALVRSKRKLPQSKFEQGSLISF